MSGTVIAFDRWPERRTTLEGGPPNSGSCRGIQTPAVWPSPRQAERMVRMGRRSCRDSPLLVRTWGKNRRGPAVL